MPLRLCVSINALYGGVALPDSLSIVMPVFNEQDVITDVISEFTQILQKFERPEFIIINDCSTDQTEMILQSEQTRIPYLRVINLPQNRGHGPALARAFREATGELIFHCDSDRQFVAEDFWLLYQKMEKEGLDAVIGWRGKRKDPFARLVLSRLLQTFLLMLYGVLLPDSNSPFRLYRRKALDRLLLVLPEQPMIPSILMLVGAKKMNMNVGWVEVRHRARTTGKSFLRSWKIFRLCTPALREVLQFKRQLP